MWYSIIVNSSKVGMILDFAMLLSPPLPKAAKMVCGDGSYFPNNVVTVLSDATIAFFPCLFGV